AKALLFHYFIKCLLIFRLWQILRFQLLDLQVLILSRGRADQFFATNIAGNEILFGTWETRFSLLYTLQAINLCGALSEIVEWHTQRRGFTNIEVASICAR